MPPVQSYDDIYNSLGSQYQPQTDLVNQQLAQLPTQQAAQQASLDQAKVNAFRDITNSANSKGVLFSGVPIDQQSTYVGTKYLPAVANLNTSFNNQKTSLLGSLNNINAQRMTTARGIQNQQQQNLAAYQKAQADEAYKQQQLQLSYARLGASQSRAATSAASKVDPLKEFGSYLQNQFKVAGANPTRQNQDAWINQWFSAHGVDSPQARQVYWDYANSTYNRPNNPYADYLYKR